MEPITIVMIVVGVLALLGVYGIHKTGWKKVMGYSGKGVAVVLSALVVVSLWQTGALTFVGEQTGLLAVTPEVPDEFVPLRVPGVVVSRVIDTFSVQAKEFGSNAWNAVGNATDGFLNIYPADQDPADPTAKYIIRVNLTSGTGEDTTKVLTTDTEYRVAFDGAGKASWYDHDYGVITFPFNNFNPSTGTFTFKMGNGGRDPIYRISKVDDIFDETDITGDINGQTNVTITNGVDIAAIEIHFDLTPGTDDTMYYNETGGDGAFYFHIDPALSEGNKYSQKYVVCFDHDDDNPPEGNEYSAFTAQLISGTDLGWPSDLLNYWVNEMCLTVPKEYMGSFSSKYKLQLTVTEGNLETGADKWYLRADDLGRWRGKDIVLNTGAPHDTVTVDST